MAHIDSGNHKIEKEKEETQKEQQSSLQHLFAKTARGNARLGRHGTDAFRSGIQKGIRRQDKKTFQVCIDGMYHCSVHLEIPAIWSSTVNRVAVTALEDIGPGVCGIAAWTLAMYDAQHSAQTVTRHLCF